MRRETTDATPEPTPGPTAAGVAEAFSILGDETRLSILFALWEPTEPFSGGSVTFSELRERVGTTDSGRFNYHLDRLVGEYVASTEAGYELRNAGLQIVRSVVTGAGIEDRSVGPTEIDETCERCGAPVAVTYEDEWLYVVCTECEGRWSDREDLPDGLLFGGEFPPAGLTDRTPQEMWRANTVRTYRAQQSAIEGVCDVCSGPMRRSLEVCTDHEDGSCVACDRKLAAVVRFSCPVCGNYHVSPPRLLVAYHPAVVSFYHHRGLSVQYDTDDPETASRVSTQLRSHEQELAATDPPRVRVTVRYEGDTLELVLDETLDVLETDEPG
jgi:DNA-binding transcriptional ArsR family regulator